jgi:hypothetical protein
MPSFRHLLAAALAGLMLASACLASSGDQNQPLAPEAAQAFEQKAARIAGQMLKGATADATVLPGIGLAEGVSEITGVAISPLLGVSAVGAWKYWQTTPSARAQLPWYCQPWAWGVGLGILALCFLKDVFGSLLPGVFKKPLDWLELFENKASALVASTAFVPLIALAMSEYQRIGPEQAGLTPLGPGLAQMPVTEILAFGMQAPWFSIPLSLVLFAVVWLTSHTVHVLIALSPFGLVDSALKLTKLAVLGLLAAATALIQTLGPAPVLLLCGVIALTSLLLASWAFRLMVFGTAMVADLLGRRKSSCQEVSRAGAAGFLSRPVSGASTRCWGRLQATADGAGCFMRRRWGVLPLQTLPLPEGELAVQKRLLYPQLMHRTTPASKWRSVCTLLPRYRGCEDAISRLLGCEVIDSPWKSGCKAAWHWLSEWSGSNRRVAVTP